MTVVGAGVLHQQVQFEILMVHELPNIVDIVEFIQHRRYEATVAAAAATVACVWGMVVFCVRFMRLRAQW